MEKYFKRKSELELSGPIRRSDDSSKQSRIEINMSDLHSDPGLRTRILDYNPNIRDEIRRAYLQKGHCQPRNHDFPQKKFGKESRRFNPAWIDEFPYWLEYSIKEDVAFCLCCYLFKTNLGEKAGGDSFVGTGFSNWKKKERFQVHVGGPNSSHNQALKKCQALMNEKQHIENVFHKHSHQSRINYRIRLNASVDCIRFLLRQGLAFRGHDESEDSSNQSNFLELLQFLVDHNEEVRAVALKNAHENLKVTSHKIQKDIVNAAEVETTDAIIRDMDDAFFSILVDESRDVSIKEQMVVMFRYVDKKGCVIERFIGIEHVTSTTAESLKASIDTLFSRHKLSMCRLRGQGYDGASNMSGEFNGLKTLIMRENESAYYVHCFAHQLQLAIVGLAKKHSLIGALFTLVSNVVNIVGASSKRRDILWDKQALKVVEALTNGELSSGKGLNQATEIKRSCDTRWGSYYGTLINFITMFSSTIDVLDEIAIDRLTVDKKHEAFILLGLVQSFDFVFSLHLMRNILGITNALSQALQRDDQDVVNAMDLVELCKQQFQKMRENGWDSLLEEVSVFCRDQSIDVPKICDMFLARGRSRRNGPKITNMHCYRVDFFYEVIALQLQELNSRFNEANTELLLCLACLSPNDSFSSFDKQKLIRLAQLYPNDFSTQELEVLKDQLQTYIDDMHSNTNFSELQGIAALAKTLVETKKDKAYPLVYLLIKLALTLPVATASVEKGILCYEHREEQNA